MDIGAKLREARESKGMTLEDVQQRTKIQKRYLKAIEENNHSVMPGDFYTRAFIKEYAQTVGLNPDEVLEPKQEQQEVPAAAPVQEESEAPSRQERSRVRENDRPPRKERKGIPYLSSIIIGLIVLAAIIAVVFIYAGGSNDNNDNNSANQQQNEDQVTDSNQSSEQNSDADNTEQSADSDDQANDAAEEEAQQEEEQAEEPKLSVDEEGTASNPVTTYTLENAGDEVTLKLSAEDGDAWLQVGDGNSAGNVYTGTIASGSEPVEQDVSDLETVSIKTGFARATKLEINGQELTFPIDNDVQTITVNIKK